MIGSRVEGFEVEGVGVLCLLSRFRVRLREEGLQLRAKRFQGSRSLKQELEDTWILGFSGSGQGSGLGIGVEEPQTPNTKPETLNP